MKLDLLRTALSFSLVGVAAARLDAQCGEWDARFDLPGANRSIDSFTTYDDGTGLQLYVGGGFNWVGGAPTARVVRWNGSQWASVGSPQGWVGVVRALLPF